MKITLHSYGHETGSTYLMCVDMVKVLEEMGHECEITLKVGEIKHSDLVIVVHPKDIMKVRKLKRYVRMDSIVLLFSPYPYGYLDAELAYMLITAKTMPLITHSSTLYGVIDKQAKELFAPALYRKMKPNMHLVNFGPHPSFESARRNDKTKFIAPFNRYAEKNNDDHAAITRRLTVMIKQKLGDDTQHTFFHADPSLSHVDKHDVSMYDTRPQLESRTEFAEALRDYGMFLSVSSGESFGLFYLELLVSGVVGVFWEGDGWVERLLPGYRYKVGSKADAHAMALHVYENYEEAREYLHSRVIPFIRENYDLKKFCERTLEIGSCE